MTINTESIEPEIRRIAIATRLDMSPCDIAVEAVEATPQSAVGDALTVDDISAVIISIEKRWYAKNTSGTLYYTTYRASNEPRLWAEEYSYHFFEYDGKTINEIIAEINEKLGAWSIETIAGEYSIRQYDNDASLTNVIKDVAEMVGCIAVLNHKTKTISFESIKTYAGTITEHDFSTQDEDLIDYTYVDEEAETTGTIVNGVYNSPFYSQDKELLIGVQNTAWSLEMVSSFDKETGEESASGEPLTVAYAEIIANASVDFENFEFEEFSEGSKFYRIGFWASATADIGMSFPDELTEMGEDDVGETTGIEVFAQIGSDSHTLDIQAHFLVNVDGPTSSSYFNIAAEKAARGFLRFLRFTIKAKVKLTGEFFEITEDESILNTMHTFYNVPVETATRVSDVPQKLADKIKWYKQNKKRVNATVAAMYYAGDTFEGGRVYSSSVEWTRDNQEWRSTVEVIGGTAE